MLCALHAGRCSACKHRTLHVKRQPACVAVCMHRDAMHACIVGFGFVLAEAVSVRPRHLHPRTPACAHGCSIIQA
eukprot:364369-Chlamydomonas_euryale.AAC.12